MTISLELLISLAVNLIAIGIIIGVYKAHLNFMREQIGELKVDMRRYNNYLERLIRVEDSTKSAHHRLDTFEKGNHQCN